MAAGRFWPAMGHPDIAIPLRADVEAAKRRALEAYRTQAHVLKYFRTNIERYRIAPDYDFTRPSPPGLALYDRLAWRMTSERWRDCAAAVSTSLEMLAS
jgi:hypothetical protein